MTDRPAKEVICEKYDYFDVFNKICYIKYNYRWVPVGRKNYYKKHITLSSRDDPQWVIH